MLVLVRIIYYKSYRGRPTGTQSKTVPALAIMSQQDCSIVVELQEPAFNYPRGYNIAVQPKDFNI